MQDLVMLEVEKLTGEKDMEVESMEDAFQDFRGSKGIVDFGGF
jgi:hypothetical protein